jgi:chromatin segregation and condensation protein Rec8/ScpA/Scc1 (kleisin family)
MPRSSLAKVPTVTLKKELARRLEDLPRLKARRDELSKQIAELQGLTAAETPPQPTTARPAGKKRRRARKAKNTVSLVDALAQAMEGKKSVSIAEAAEAVLASGYKSKSRDFPNLVGMTLSHDERFERVSRGCYRVKG